MGLNVPVIVLAILSGGLAIAVIVLSVSLANATSENQTSPSTESTVTSSDTSSSSPTMTTPGYQEEWEKDYRLPADTLPLHYEIYLHPDLKEGTFTGKVDIHLNITSPRTFLLVHTKYLTINSTQVVQGLQAEGGSLVQVAEAFEYPRNEFWVIKLKNEIQPGSYQVKLEFSGSLTKDIVGFYKSEYYDPESNSTRTIATSKFEPTYARRAFPCLDEPSYKSTFGVTLVRPTGDNYKAYSNMPVKEEIPEQPFRGLTTVKFEKSVEMVTYLACFIVCDFKEKEAKTKRGVPIRTIARRNQYESIDYPLKIGVNVTDFYEEYFDIDYVLPKQDLIAIPDFVSGAMEHWGLVTFRETSLLFNSRKNALSNQKRVATVVAHELAHQWFGNLMTIRWWNDLWLNEGFASYMEFKGTDYCEPEWDIMTQMLSDDVGPVLKLDAKYSSHPIVQPVNHPDEITEIFDSISYSKGASVLMMLEAFMGESNFRDGIRKFLKKYKFANAETSDLWDELQSVTPDLNISRIMDTWTKQMGFPVLTYTLNDNQIVIKQNRFVSDPNANATATPSDYGYKWDVPVFIQTDKSVANLTWLYYDKEDVTVTLPSGFSWLKLNAGQKGFFRVNYTVEHWNALSHALNKTIDLIPPSDRWGLIDDSFSLSSAGLLSYSTSLELVQYVRDETHPVPWNAASDKLTSISNLVYGTALYPGFRKFVVTLIEKPFSILGWEDEGTFLEKTLRSTVLSLACLSEYEPCLEGAAERLQKWIDDENEYIPPNFRNIVYRYGIAQIGDARVWNIMWERFLAESDPSEAIKLLYGLAFAKEPWILQQYIELAKISVRSQDFFTVLQYISDNPVGLPIVWDFIRSEWDYLVDRFSINNRYLGNMVSYVTSHFKTQLRLDEMNAFFTKYPDAGAGARAREQALETVQNNINWLSNNTPEIEKWLKANNFM